MPIPVVLSMYDAGSIGERCGAQPSVVKASQTPLRNRREMSHTKLGQHAFKSKLYVQSSDAAILHLVAETKMASSCKHWTYRYDLQTTCETSKVFYCLRLLPLTQYSEADLKTTGGPLKPFSLT